MAVLHLTMRDPARESAPDAAADAAADAPLVAAMQALCEIGGTRPTSHFTRLASGKTIHHLELGAGPPLLLIHGAGGGAANWYRILAALSKGHWILAVDLPGFGLSDTVEPQAPLGVQTARILDEWLDIVLSGKARDRDRDRDGDGGALGMGDRVGVTTTTIPSATPSPSPTPIPPQSQSPSQSRSRAFLKIIATSFGGLAALRLADHARIEKLVLIDSAGAGPEVSTLVGLANLSIAPLFLKPSRAGTRWMLRHVLMRGRLPSHEEKALVEYLYLSARRAGTQFMVRALRLFTGQRGQAELPESAELATVTAPTLIVWGARDRFFPLSHATALGIRMPNADVVVLENAGHSPNWEQPDRLAAVLLEFLQRDRH